MCIILTNSSAYCTFGMHIHYPSRIKKVLSIRNIGYLVWFWSPYNSIQDSQADYAVLGPRLYLSWLRASEADVLVTTLNF